MKNYIKKLSVLLIITFMLSMLSLPHNVLSQEYVYIHGYVFDEHGKPIPHTLIIALNYQFLTVANYTYTDKNGHYAFYARAGVGYVLYAIHYNPKTKLMDYIPAKVDAMEFKDAIEINANFTLYKAAYVKAIGRVYYVGGSPTEVLLIDILSVSSTPIRYVLPAGKALITTTFGKNETKAYLLDEYGTSSDITLALSIVVKAGILPKTAVNKHIGLVPANHKVIIRVLTRVKDRRSPEGVQSIGFIKDLVIERGSPAAPLILKPEQVLTIDLSHESIARAISLVQGDLEFTNRFINKYEAYGFYLAAEREELSKASSYVDQAIKLYKSGGSPAEVCELLDKAFIIARDVIPKRIKFMEAVAVRGASILPGVIAVFAATLAFYFTEERKKKVFYFLVFYFALLAIFAFSYPGFYLIDKTWLLISVFGFLAAVYFIIFILPKYVKEPEVPGKLSRGALIAVTFSMAKRYSKLRKSRTLITVFSLTALIWAFTVLASISTVYGFVMVKESFTPPEQGILIRHLINGTVPAPLGYYDYLWFKNTSGVITVAPRVYAQPMSGLELIIQKDGRIAKLKAVLGLSKYEDQITKISNILIEGNFANIAKDNAIILPENVAEQLDIKVGDVVNVTFTLPGKISPTMKFVVVGIFSPTKLDLIKDIDNKPLKPILFIKGKYLPANSTDIAIFNWQTLLKKVFYEESIGASSINSIYSIAALADKKLMKSIAKSYIERKGSGFVAWIGINHECWKATFGMKTENIFQRNIAFIVPILIVIFNVIISMYSIVHERRREIYIFNAIGFNPTQIAMIFLAESIVYGLLGGGIGYIAGMLTFKLMTICASYGGIIVREKLEWYWSIIAIFISILVSMISAFKPALNAAFMYSPTLVKKYKIEETEREKREEMFLKTTTGKTVGISLRVSEYEAPIFFSFFYTRLKDLAGGYTERTEQVEELPEEEYPDGKRIKRFRFKYIFLTSEGERYEINCEAIMTKMPQADYYTVELNTQPTQRKHIPIKYLDRVATVVSDICKEWQREKKRLLGG